MRQPKFGTTYMAVNPASTHPSIMNVLVMVTNTPRCLVGAYSETMVTLKGMTAPTPMPDSIRHTANAS